MTKRGGVVRLEPLGPEGVGLSPMTLNPEDFQSALPEQQIHLYFEDPVRGISVGVWTTTDMQEAFGPYPGDEFMTVLEGQVLMTDGKGGAVSVETGRSFVLKNGIPVSWKQEGFLRKFFLLYLDPRAPRPEIASADGGVVVLEPETLSSLAVPTSPSIGGGSQREAVAFTNDRGNMTVGFWETTAFESRMQAFSVHEFAQILDGAVSIEEENGQTHRFATGDAFFVPKGTVCRWRSDGPMRKYYATLSIDG